VNCPGGSTELANGGTREGRALIEPLQSSDRGDETDTYGRLDLDARSWALAGSGWLPCRWPQRDSLDSRYKRARLYIKVLSSFLMLDYVSFFCFFCGLYRARRAV
jgi:hypothetical protein